MEANLDYAEEVVREVLTKLDHPAGLGLSPACAGSWDGTWRIRPSNRDPAQRLSKGVPVFIPAFTDSELGLDLAVYMVRQATARVRNYPRPSLLLSVKFNPFLDLGRYAQKVLGGQKTGDLHRRRRGAPQLGPAGGPVPGTPPRPPGARHTGSDRSNTGCASAPSRPIGAGLSGSPYREGISWGKFKAPEDGGRYAEVLCDATISWPLIMKAVQQRLEKNK